MKIKLADGSMANTEAIPLFVAFAEEFLGRCERKEVKSYRTRAALFYAMRRYQEQNPADVLEAFTECGREILRRAADGEFNLDVIDIPAVERAMLVAFALDPQKKMAQL
jgi:hypothetical protein